MTLKEELLRKAKSGEPFHGGAKPDNSVGNVSDDLDVQMEFEEQQDEEQQDTLQPNFDEDFSDVNLDFGEEDEENDYSYEEETPQESEPEPEPEYTPKPKPQRKPKPEPQYIEEQYEPEPQYVEQQHYEPEPQHYDPEPQHYDPEPQYVPQKQQYTPRQQYAPQQHTSNSNELSEKLVALAKRTVLERILSGFQSNIVTPEALTKIVAEYNGSQKSGISNGNAILSAVIDEALNDDFKEEHYDNLTADILMAVKKDLGTLR